MKWLFLLLGFSCMLISCEKKKTIDPKFDDSLYQQVNTLFYKRKSDSAAFIRTSELVTVKDSGNKRIYYYKEVPGIDIDSYQKQAFGGFYGVDNKNVYTWDNGPQGEIVEILKDADRNTFTPIGYMWAKDKKHVFYGKNLVKGLDPSELTIVCADNSDSINVYIDYIRDNDQLFYKDQEVKVPEDIDLTRLTCKEDLFGNPFVAYNNHLYIIKNGRLELYQ